MPRHLCTCTGAQGIYCERCTHLLRLARANGCPPEPPESSVDVSGGRTGLLSRGAPGGAQAGSERDFQARVVALAKANGWLWYFTHRSDHSPAGFPDLVLCKPGRLLFVECKTRLGKLTQAQALWLDMLMHSVPGVEVAVWRPADMAHILATLRGP